MGTDFTYAENVLTFTSGGEYTVTMIDRVTFTTADRIVVSASGDITLTLSSINVTSSTASPLEVNTTSAVTILLSGTNVLTSTASGYAGLQKTSTDNTLTITSANGDGSTDGSLTATGGTSGAGIGGGADSDGSNITISGGTVKATGGAGNYGGAGIGGGGGSTAAGSGTNITIEGGTVTANGGGATTTEGSNISVVVYGGAGIGGGGSTAGGSGTDITITGGTVAATGGGTAEAVSSSGTAYGFGYGGAGIGGGGGSTGGAGTDIAIKGGAVEASGGGTATATAGTSGSIASSFGIGGAGIGGGGGNSTGGNGDTITIENSTVIATGGGKAEAESNTYSAGGYGIGGAGIGGGSSGASKCTGGSGTNITVRNSEVTAEGGGTATAESGSDTATTYGTGGAGIGGGGSRYYIGGTGSTITIESSTVKATGGGTATSVSSSGSAISHGTGGAGIGGGGGNSIGGTGDTITIKSGTVTATGGGTASGSYSYGVGGAGVGGGGSCGGTSTGGDGSNIKITGGTVTATGGGTYGSTTYGGAGIGGGGGHSSGGTGSGIAISGGYILAAAGRTDAEAIGAGSSGTTGTVSITGGYYGEGSTTANTVYDVEVANGYGVAANTDSDTKGTYPVYVTTQATCGDFVVTSGGTLGTDFTYENNVLTFLTGGEYTVAMNTANNITSTTTDRIVVSANSAITLTLYNVDVTSSSYTPLEVNASAAVTIALSGTNVLTSTAEAYAGLQKTSTANTLTITSANGDGSTDGSLTATGGDYAAGIGGGYCGSGNGITISGGTVMATGAQYGAGIGGGAVGSGTNITIDGGAVTAIGGGGVYGGAGIGGGYQGSGTNITIDGGAVTAIGGGTCGGAGIGGGFNGNGSDITITDSEVTATGGGTTNDYFITYGGAGIGGGYNGSGSNITIMGSTVTATGGGGDTTSEYYYGGAGIGGGYGGSGSGITITDSEVTATGGTYGGAGIGGGSGKDGDNITIEGGSVTATGGESAAGIGGGSGGDGSNITITGGYILATAGSNASAIGGGENGTTGTITITGGCFGTGVLADSTDPVGTVYTIAPANGYCVESNTEENTQVIYPYLVTVCTYTVTLESNGGTITEGKKVTSYVYGIGATLPDSDSISKEGYTFGGWYEESDFSGSAVTGIGTSDYGNKTYYACWSCTHNFPYSYNVSDGASENSKVLTATCSGCKVTLTYTLAAPEESGLTYDGNSHDATVSLGEEDALYSYASDMSTVLPKTLMITYSYSDTESGTKGSVSETKAAGYYTASITLGEATASVSYQVSQASISKSDFTVDTDGETYTGSAITKTITKTITSNLTENTDYSVTYAGNTNAGTATITITGSGNYTGELIYSFTINQKELTASINGTTSKVYDGTTAVTDDQNLSVTLDGVVAGDTVSVAASGYAYDTASVGTGKTITASGLTLSGSKAGNYTLADTSVTVSGSITAKEITVTITPNGGTYGGTITAATATLDGVITADEDNMPVTLTYTGTANDGTEYESTTAPNLAGTYTVTATISDTNYSLTETITAEFVVEKAVPTITLSDSTAVYTGEAVAYGNAAAGEATVGEAAVTLVNGETYDAAINGAITYTYYTDEDCTILTGSEGETASGAAGEGAAPVNAGTYYVKASIAEQDNYTAAVSTAAKLTIELKTVGLTWSTLTESELVYDGSAKTLTASVSNLASGDEVSVTAALTDGTDNVNVTEEGFSYIATALTGADSGNYCLPDGVAEKTSATYYITSAELTNLSVAQSGTLTYDGTAQTADVTASAKTVDGTDIDVTFTYSTSKNGEYSASVPAFTNAGTYMVYYRAEAANHETVEGSFIITIAAKSVTASISGTTEKTYDGTTGTTADQGLSIGLSGVVDGDTVTAAATGYAYNSADVDSASTITATGITLSGEDAGNYELTSTTATTDGTITAKGITVTITANGGTYGGTITAATATLDGVIDADEGNVDVALTYTGTANDGTEYESTTAPTLAGTYTVTAAISDSNYSLTGTTTAEFVIVKASYDMSGVSFTDATYTYDGTEKTLTITGSESLPDGVSVSYTDNSLTDAGSIEVTATFSGDADNYEAIESKMATLTIINADFTITVTGYKGAYDGDAHSITVTVEDGITVTYSAVENSGFSEEILAYTEAGTYTVYYKASKANYNDVTGSATVVITQAEGEGSVSITGWTYGDYDADTNSPVPTSSTNGTDNVTYLYKVQGADDSTYTDEVPTDAGSYTVQATFASTNNYQAVTVTADFIINQRAITVTIDSKSSAYGDEIEELTAAVTEGSIAESDTDVYSLSTTATSTSAAGTYDITGAVLDDNYSITFENEEGVYTITAAKLTDVTASQSGTLTYDGTAQTAAVTASAKTADGADDDVTFTYSTSENGEYSTEVPAFTDAGTYTVYYQAEAANHTTVSGTFTVTIAKAVYDMSGVSFADATFEYDGEEKVLEISGTLPDGVTVTYSDNALTEAGSTTATASFTVDSDNYEAIEPMTATLTVAVLAELPEQMFPDEDAKHKIELREGLSEVPEALQDNPELDTVEKIEVMLKTVVSEQAGYTEENIAIYDVILMVSFDGGKTWEKATEENFPEEGLTIVLPYPEGTNKDEYDFFVTHMFTSTAFGKTPGDTENPAVTKTEDGLQVTVTGLSPVAVAWKLITQSSGETETETEPETETETEIETETETETETKTETTAQSETETESQTIETETETETEASAQTGDETPLGMWLTLLLLSAAVLLMMGERKRQRR